jgi:hypothetical protein
MSPSTSSAESVRTYFHTILTEHYSIPSSEASTIVSAWRYGRTKEVINFEIETYREIFGPEIGALLYGWRLKYGTHVAGMKWEDWKRGEVEEDRMTCKLCSIFLDYWLYGRRAGGRNE